MRLQFCQEGAIELLLSFDSIIVTKRTDFGFKRTDLGYVRNNRTFGD